MKLFRVDLMDDTENYTEIVVAKSSEEAEKKVSEMDCWSCLMFIKASCIDKVDGFSILIENTLKL